MYSNNMLWDFYVEKVNQTETAVGLCKLIHDLRAERRSRARAIADNVRRSHMFLYVGERAGGCWTLTRAGSAAWSPHSGRRGGRNLEEVVCTRRYLFV